MKLKTKGVITSLNIKGGEVRISIDVGMEDVAIDELKRMLDKEIFLTINDNQSKLEV